MKMKKCPFCAAEIQDEAIKCKYCREFLVVSKIQKIGGAKRMAGEPSILWVWIPATLAVLIFLSNHSSTSSSKPIQPDNFTLCYIAETEVKKRLKAPATAKFPDYNACKVIKIKDGPLSTKWQIDSYVDAENSFSAKIRTFYSVIIETVGGDQWQLISVDFN